MMILIKYVKASANFHNTFVRKYVVPKSWLSIDDLHEQDMKHDLNEEIFLSVNMNATHGHEETFHEEVHKFLSDKHK